MIYKEKLISYANRGMALENDINLTNKYYLDKDIAIIHKKPTPIKVTKVSYTGPRKALIKEGFYEMPSTTDYNGIYKAKYIDFDAKEVRNSTNFSLSNLHEHQIAHLVKVYKHGGISFLIVRFYGKNKTYLLETKSIMEFIDMEKRKSIPLSYFENFGYEIKEGYVPRLDYIKVVNNLYFSKKENL